MTPSVFAVFTASHFDREYKKLASKHPELPTHFAAVVAILQLDPYNLSRTHPIKKLEGIAPGHGQLRIRSGRFRFRYDVDCQKVFLKACALRDESTYRR